jgi:hypothetical protein
VAARSTVGGGESYSITEVIRKVNDTYDNRTSVAKCCFTSYIVRAKLYIRKYSNWWYHDSSEVNLLEKVVDA